MAIKVIRPNGIITGNDSVRVSNADRVGNYLGEKIAAGTGVTLATLNAGEDEQLEITSTGANTFKVSADDTTPGTLEEKLVDGTGITLTTLSPAGNEQLEISSTGASTVAVSVDDTTPDYLQSKIVSGNGITFTILNPEGNEQIEVNADAWAEDYLELPELASDPSTPASGKARLYVKTDESLYLRFDDGDVVEVGGGAGATELNELSDVTITTPSDDQFLRYNGAGQWINETVAIGGAEELDDLTDVTITTPAVNQMLLRGASVFANRPYMPTAMVNVLNSNTIPLTNADPIFLPVHTHANITAAAVSNGSTSSDMWHTEDSFYAWRTLPSMGDGMIVISGFVTTNIAAFGVSDVEVFFVCDNFASGDASSLIAGSTYGYKIDQKIIGNQLTADDYFSINFAFLPTNTNNKWFGIGLRLDTDESVDVQYALRATWVELS